MKLTDSITVLKGVGPKRARSLGQLGIATVGDLLNHFPSRVEFPPEVRRLDGLEDGIVATAVGRVSRVTSGYTSPDFSCQVVTNYGEAITCRWFNMGRRMHGMGVQEGTGIMLFGSCGGPIAFTNPEFRVFPVNYEPDISNLRVVTYPVTNGITSRDISRYVKQVLQLASSNVRSVHDPVDQAAYDTAVRQEKYNELFYMQLALALRHKQRRDVDTKVQCMPTPKSIEDYFPFEFTGDQRQAVRDIQGDMCKEHSMNRLLQGDVGCGKTAVAAHAAMVMACNGGQTAILCPTQVLAEQHHRAMEEWFGAAGLSVKLLTGGTAVGSDKDTFGNGRVDVVIGTTALLSTGVMFHRLGLVVVDEQHKFGVEQRAALAQHGNPHVLLMTATPIPRTIAMTAFGDLDVSVIKEMPPGRMPVHTEWVGDVVDIHARVDHELGEGNQVYVVCPRIEALDDEMRAVEEVAREYRDRFPGASLGILHGQMTEDQKQLAQQWWGTPGMIGKILVATTVIEVGVDNPNATVMVVEGAERFGLAQLHQLRGRVGRSDKQSYCFLLSDTESHEGRARLKAMERTNDGFLIAEEDLKNRGPGDILGTEQHGLPPLKIADLVQDFDLMVEARDQAQNIMACRLPAYDQHLAELKRRYGDVLHLGGTG
ncbi:MAG: ATP-dependent DNA helicase RecG [Chloroflexi bacterium]|nr:ATP-dependent DNA helicase RecG [Chloroflexota bacterium]